MDPLCRCAIEEQVGPVRLVLRSWLLDVGRNLGRVNHGACERLFALLCRND